MTTFFLVLLLLFFLQFFLFRIPVIYRLSLKTQLYDYAKWVKTKPKVLIMGSSHARSHVSPLEISKYSKKYEYEEIYNIGADAASPFAMYTTYIKNRRKFEDVELVYYTLDPHMLGEKYFLYTKYEKIFLTFKQWRYFTKHHKNYLKKHHQESNKYFFPSIIFFKAIELNRRIFSGRNNGYSPLKHKKYKTTQKNTIAKYIYEPFDIFPVSTFELEYLGKLKKILEDDGKKMIFILSPTYKWALFYAEEAQEYDEKLVTSLNEGIKDSIVLGSLFGEDFKLKYEDYADDTHLADSGAKKFTREIFQDIDMHYLLEETKVKETFSYRLE